MDRIPASHRTTALLLLVFLATQGLSYSRGNLNEVGLTSFLEVLLGLAPLLLLGHRWTGSSQTAGGFATWQVALPVLYVYLFVASAGRHLLVFSPDLFRPLLQLLTLAAAALSVPVLLLTGARLRERLLTRAQAVLLLLPLLPAAMVFLLVTSVSPEARIDVFHIQQQGAQALVAGRNPYAITYVDTYGAPEFYPDDVANAYPYPPLSLLFAVVGNGLGDLRWVQIAGHAAASLLIYAAARARRVPVGEAIMFAGLFYYLPWAPFVNEQAWTDPSVVLGLAAFSYLLARRRPQAALWAAGYCLALKQTMVLLLPLLWGLWRRLTVRHGVALFALAAASYGVFLLWGPTDLWHDLVTFHLATPFRDNALTLSAYLHYLKLETLPGWLSAVGVAGGWAASLWALRAGATAAPDDADRVWRLFTGLAFTWLLTLLLSKHAFMNYYYVHQFALVSALVWSRIADLEAAPAAAAS